MSVPSVRLLRADLHVHSWHSARANNLRFLHARDCYSEPDAVYATAKARGMDVVTITDHDTVDGCVEFLSRHSDADDFFISEEIECRFPNVDLKVHIGAYDISERIHREIQPLRRNVFEAAAYLRAEGVIYALNHPFFFYKGQLPLDEYLNAALTLFPAFEVRNGTMLAAHNQLSEDIVRAANLSGMSVSPTAGSDSHTLMGVATTFTEAPGSTRDEFLQSLRDGRGRVGGRHGTAWREAQEIYGVIANYWKCLLGGGRGQLSWPRRMLGLSFSAATMPFEFAPLLIAGAHKRDETRRIAQYRHKWETEHAADRPAVAPLARPRLTLESGERQP